MYKKNRIALTILLIVIATQGILVIYTLASMINKASERDEVAARHIGAALAISVAPLLRQAADASTLEPMLDIVRSENLIGYAAIMRNGRVLASGSHKLSHAERQLMTLVKQTIGKKDKPLGEIVLGIVHPEIDLFNPYFIALFISLTGLAFLLLNYQTAATPIEKVKSCKLAGFVVKEEPKTSKRKYPSFSEDAPVSKAIFAKEQTAHKGNRDDKDNVIIAVSESPSARSVTKDSNTSEVPLSDSSNHSLALSQAIFQNIVDPIIVVDVACNIVDFNPATEVMFGSAIDEMCGKHLSSLILTEENPENSLTHRDLVRANNSGESIRLVAQNSAGKIVPIDVSISIFDQGRQQRFLLHIHNLTELDMVQAELRLADHAFQSTDAMFIADDNGKILRVNRTFTDVTGYTAEEVMGKPMAILAATDGEIIFYQAIRRALARENKWRGEVLHKQKNGNVIPILVFATAMRERNGTLTHFIAHFIDVSEHKKNEQMLRDAQKSAEQANISKGRFLAAMSHEIRTPMNGVLGVLELISESTLSDKQRKLLQTAQHSGNLLLSIINDILDFSRLEAGKLRLAANPMDLSELLRQTTEIMLPKAKSKGLEMTLDISPAVPRYVSGDADRIRQILLNLVGNAVKYTERGAVKVSVFNGNHRADVCNLICVISDSGIGISPESLPTIFEEFSTAENARHYKNDSTGLGLFICKQLITLMGGTIDISSAPGIGTTVRFEVSLPTSSQFNVAKEQVPRPLIHQTLHQRINKDLRLLVAEDNVANQLVISSMLELDNLKADIVNNGAEAITAVKNADYDIILMDISMPGVNGIEATQNIRKMESPKSDVVIVALTSHALSNDQEKFISCGMNDCVTKPIDRTTLLTTLVKWQDVSRDGSLQPQADNQGFTYQRLDQERFNVLLEDLEPSMIPELIHIYTRDTRHRVYEIHKAISDKDFDRIKFEAHSIISSAEVHGNLLLSGLCKSLEELCIKKEHTKALDIAEDIVQEAEMSLQALEQVVRNQWQEKHKA
ncbi:PAS domain-containing hybrid sensor histidine kinase/response regulator [Veronia pacifica]|uniref:Sensory/regulatory protein RpfC n=1 Tax=Veronia pacifica TaxID=1080227 RepID=A0A1C3EB60_9GAMM|nr:PAS domain S-box protein [Veronia pacifica]ODA30475.1 hypothetical protein A8L45_20270 [Veronia pacifica]